MISRPQDVLPRLREYLTLRETQAAAQRASNQVRSAAAAALVRAWQKRDSAETLLARGMHAESIRLARESVEPVRDAVQRLDEAGLPVSAAARRRVADLAFLDGELATAEPFDRRVPPGQATALAALLRTELSLEQDLAPLLLDGRGLRRLQLRRWTVAALVVTAPLALATFLRQSYFGLDARASSALDDEYTADRVLDGDPDTEWVPSYGDEWLEVRFRPRVVHGVSLLNGDLLPERAANEVRFEFYFQNELKSSGTKQFTGPYPAEWIRFDTAGVKADRVRVVIVSHFGNGGALAEVRLD
jgi:hypothetical protein